MGSRIGKGLTPEELAASLKPRFAEMRTDLTETKANLVEVKADVAELKRGMGALMRTFETNHAEIMSLLNQLIEQRR